MSRPRCPAARPTRRRTAATNRSHRATRIAPPRQSPRSLPFEMRKGARLIARFWTGVFLLCSATADRSAPLTLSCRQGPNETTYVEDKDVAIEYRGSHRTVGDKLGW